MDTVPVQPDDSTEISLEEFIGASRLNARLANTMAQLEGMLNGAVAHIQELEAELATLRPAPANPEAGAPSSPLAAVPD